MTSSGKHYKRGFQLLVYHRDADFELNTSVILSASGNMLFSEVFICIVYIIAVYKHTDIYLLSYIWSI